MQSTVSLNGTTYDFATIKHTPIRISTVLEYHSGKRQEFYRTTKGAIDLSFYIPESLLAALSAIGTSGSVITFIDPYSVTYSMRPTAFSYEPMENVLPTAPRFLVSLSLEQVG